MCDLSVFDYLSFSKRALSRFPCSPTDALSQKARSAAFCSLFSLLLQAKWNPQLWPSPSQPAAAARALIHCERAPAPPLQEP